MCIAMSSLTLPSSLKLLYSQLAQTTTSQWKKLTATIGSRKDSSAAAQMNVSDNASEHNGGAIPTSNF